MIQKHKSPWEKGSVFICTKCGAKSNLPTLAEEVKVEIKKELKATDDNSNIRVMTSGCLGVCAPERQTFSYQPTNGEVEIYTTELDRLVVLFEVRNLVNEKLK